MTTHNYSTKIKEGMAKAVATSLPISTKQSIEICSFIKNRDLDDARETLKKVIEKKLALPFKRFRGGVGHKKGMASGRYPQKACRELVKVLDMVEANAQHKGLSSSLKIKSILAQKASTPWHFGRQRRRKMKRTHIEVIVEETKKDVKKEKEVKEIKKEPIKKEEVKRVEEKIKKETKEEIEEKKEIQKKEVKGKTEEEIGK